MFDLEWMKGLNLADGIEALKPAAYFAISVGVFSFAIFHLHRFMSKNDFFLIDVSPLRKSGRLLSTLLFCVIYLFRYTLLLPMFTYLCSGSWWLSWPSSTTPGNRVRCC